MFTALTLLSQGAQQNTFEQIVHGLYLGQDKSTTATEFVKHYEILNERAGEVTLSIVNQLYLNQGSQIKKAFHDAAVNKFKSGIESLNFAEPASAAAAVNSFVERKTNNKIKNLIQSDSFSAETRLVLVNVVHFKGDWQNQFDIFRTESGQFFTDETNSIQVEFMGNEDYYPFAELNDIDAKALELKYKNSNISFVIVLPNKRTGLSSLEASLQDHSIFDIRSHLRETKVDVSMPKFKFEYEINMMGILQKVSSPKLIYRFKMKYSFLIYIAGYG